MQAIAYLLLLAVIVSHSALCQASTASFSFYESSVEAKPGFLKEGHGDGVGAWPGRGLLQVNSSHTELFRTHRPTTSATVESKNYEILVRQDEAASLRSNHCNIHGKAVVPFKKLLGWTAPFFTPLQLCFNVSSVTPCGNEKSPEFQVGLLFTPANVRTKLTPAMPLTQGHYCFAWSYCELASLFAHLDSKALVDQKASVNFKSRHVLATSVKFHLFGVASIVETEAPSFATESRWPVANIHVCRSLPLRECEARWESSKTPAAISAVVNYDAVHVVQCNAASTKNSLFLARVQELGAGSSYATPKINSYAKTKPIDITVSAESNDLEIREAKYEADFLVSGKWEGVTATPLKICAKLPVCAPAPTQPPSDEESSSTTPIPSAVPSLVFSLSISYAKQSVPLYKDFVQPVDLGESASSVMAEAAYANVAKAEGSEVKECTTGKVTRGICFSVGYDAVVNSLGLLQVTAASQAEVKPAIDISEVKLQIAFKVNDLTLEGKPSVSIAGATFKADDTPADDLVPIGAFSGPIAIVRAQKGCEKEPTKCKAFLSTQAAEKKAPAGDITLYCGTENGIYSCSGFWGGATPYENYVRSFVDTEDGSITKYEGLAILEGAKAIEHETSKEAEANMQVSTEEAIWATLNERKASEAAVASSLEAVRQQKEEERMSNITAAEASYNRRRQERTYSEPSGGLRSRKVSWVVGLTSSFAVVVLFA